MFITAGVRASKIPKSSLSVTLNRKIEAPGLIHAAALFMWAGSPKIPRPKHSSIVSLLQPKIKPALKKNATVLEIRNRNYTTLEFLTAFLLRQYVPGPGIVGHAISFVSGARKSVKMSSGDGGSILPVHDSYNVTRGEFHIAFISFSPVLAVTI